MKLYEQLFKVNSSRYRETEWWKLQSLWIINARKCENKHDTPKNIDNMRSLEPARYAYVKFRNHAVSSRQKPTVNLIIRLDAILTDVVESFKGQTSDKAKRAPSCEADTNTTPSREPVLDFFKVSMSHRGKSIPQESSTILRSFLPIAAVKFLHSCFLIFQQGHVHAKKNFDKSFPYYPANPMKRR